ncbi:MAG: DUF1330 domain-containing protein [Candidatus Thiodiazotropha taylori]
MTPSIDNLIQTYGEGAGVPTREQWLRLLEGDPTKPLTVLNLFKLRERADPTLIDEEMSGLQAFEKYTETSVPKVTEVGGHFVLRGLFEGGFIGEGLESWDILAIGQYPERACFLRLLSDSQYQSAFKYRQAAVANENVFLISAM